MQHAGGLAISAVTAGERWTWGARKKASEKSRTAVFNFLNLLDIVEIDLTIAIRFGDLRGLLLDNGTPIPDMDGLIAASALAENMTLVTHNVADFQAVPDLRIEDWLA